MTKLLDYLAMFLGIVFVIVPQIVRKYYLEAISKMKEGF
jgi:hypothetical protein